MHHVMLLLLWAAAALAYTERLRLRPLPRNTLLVSFDFDTTSPPMPLHYENGTAETHTRHYGHFPRLVAPVLQATNTRELHLRFGQGWWDHETWGLLPQNGLFSGGTGVEIWAAIEAPDAAAAQRAWLRLTQLLLGFFCALLNFVSMAITTMPQHLDDAGATYVASADNSVYVLRAALPDEPICTENLTPFLKMLPTRGRAGVASLLDGHKLYDSLWHSMSVDVYTVCDGECRLQAKQHIHQVVDVRRLQRRQREGGIPRPVPGNELRCDPTKQLDQWHCFPLPDETEVEWDVASLFGRPIKGCGLEGHPSVVETLVGDTWTVELNGKLVDGVYVLDSAQPYNFHFRSNDSRVVHPTAPPPVVVARSLTGFSQDKGGVRISLANPTSNTIEVVYVESMPWFMRIYLHTMRTSGAGTVANRFYRPAIDRQRPSHLELKVLIPAHLAMTIAYLFDKALLKYAEYPPDANHGFAVAPAVVKVVEGNETVYQLRTPSLLLTLPTPDFSMPYNVIIFTCTVMSLAFGTVFNLLTKKVVTEEEFEAALRNLPLQRLRRFLGR